MGIKILVAVSDPHCGSTVGLMPPEVELSEHTVKHNAFQAWLWDNWMDLWENRIPEIVGEDDFALAINGDMVDGNHHRTKQIVSPNEGDHSLIALACFEKPASMAKKLFITRGTESHTNDYEHPIGVRLGAVEDPNTKRASFDALHLKMHGCHGILRHHINTATRTYTEAGQFSAHLTNERAEAARQGHPIPKFMLRAHRHRHGVFSDGMGIIGVTGAWQGLTRYGHKVVPGAVCNPSAIIFDWRGLPKGSVPNYRQIIYKPKSEKYVKI